MDMLLNLNTQMVAAITKLQVARAHGRNNPIIIEDSLLQEIIEDPAPPYEGDHVVNDREESPEV